MSAYANANGPASSRLPVKFTINFYQFVTLQFWKMDGDWTMANAPSGQPNQKKKTIEAEYPSKDKFALRQLGTKKPDFSKSKVQTKIPVVQQGTGPFGNEWDPSRSYPALNTHQDQGGRFCVLISGVSLLVQ
jgi:hypothetical protein